MINFRTIDDMRLTVLRDLIPQFASKYKLKGIWGVPRSGMLPASIIATHLHLPLGMASSPHLAGGLRSKRHQRPGGNFHLLVEDCTGGGGGINSAYQQLHAQLNEPILRVAAYSTSQGSKHLDYYGELLEQPRLFEWNWLNSDIITNTMTDMDGVLCEDHGDIVDGDPRYLDFLQDAKPLYTPTFPLGTIITARLEQHRGVTEAWLRQHGIQYKELIMHPAKTPAERRSRPDYGAWKGTFYQESDHALFVESSIIQARRIAETGKPVLCTHDGTRLEMLQ